MRFETRISLQGRAEREVRRIGVIDIERAAAIGVLRNLSGCPDAPDANALVLDHADAGDIDQLLRLEDAKDHLSAGHAASAVKEYKNQLRSDGHSA